MLRAHYYFTLAAKWAATMAPCKYFIYAFLISTVAFTYAAYILLTPALSTLLAFSLLSYYNKMLIMMPIFLPQILMYNADKYRATFTAFITCLPRERLLFLSPMRYLIDFPDLILERRDIYGYQRDARHAHDERFSIANA